MEQKTNSELLNGEEFCKALDSKGDYLKGWNSAARKELQQLRQTYLDFYNPKYKKILMINGCDGPGNGFRSVNVPNIFCFLDKMLEVDGAKIIGFRDYNNPVSSNDLLNLDDIIYRGKTVCDGGFDNNLVVGPITNHVEKGKKAILFLEEQHLLGCCIGDWELKHYRDLKSKGKDISIITASYRSLFTNFYKIL
ncbi:MAG: hypothetical protein WC781_04130 [Candidatus Pacearchaeota archaeon]|jgi:hypothetical protein